MFGNLESLSDEKIVFEMVDSNGDSERYFNEIYRRYSQRIFAFSLKRLKDSEKAQDNANSTFLKFNKNVGTYSPRSAFSTWLFSIAKNNVIDMIRKDKSRNLEKTFSEAFGNVDYGSDVIEMDEYFARFGDSPKNPEETMITNKIIGRIMYHLECLGKSKGVNYSVPLSLRYFENKSYKDIQAELGISLESVKGQIFRGKQLLREKFAKDKYLN